MYETYGTITDRIKIETYWNVNFLLHGLQFVLIPIKIETYWNVNDIDKYALDFMGEIKIETYWNVNMLPRYGCTAMYCLIKIETYWNVNVFVDGTSPITTELK